MTRTAGLGVLCTLLAAGGASATPQWSAPIPLSTSSRALGPELAMSGSGHAVVVWDREEGADCASSPASLGCVHIVTSRSRGAGWAAETEVNRPGVGARPLAATNDAGNESVMWVHDIGADRVLQAVFRPSSSDPFPNAEDLSKEVQEVRSHEIAMDGAGNLVAVWAQRLGTRLTVQTEWRPRHGAWTAATPLSVPAPDAGFFGPDLDVNPAGDAVAAWVESGLVVAAVGKVAAQTWASRDVLTTADGIGEGDPSVVVDDAGDAVAAWAWLNGTTGRLAVQAAFRPAGGEWAVTTLGEVVGAVAPHPRAAIDGLAGNVTVVWVGGTGRTSLETAGRSFAGTWSDPSTIVPSGASDPDLAVDPRGDAVVVWRNQGTRRIEASIRPGPAAAWQPRTFVSPADPSLDAVDASGARVAMDAAGHAVAVWQRGTGAVAVETADLSGSWAPTLENTRRPLIRGNARVGARLRCLRGAWEGTVPISYGYAWLRNGRAVRGVRGSGYTVRRADAGTRIACRVTATNSAGAVAARSRPVRVRR